MQQSDGGMFSTLLSLPQLSKARTIFLFWGIPGLEPDTSRLIPRLLGMGKQVCLPRMLEGRAMELRLYTPDCPMAANHFGISEPTVDCPLVDKQSIDLVVVPALCYDRAGYRLGYGGGYYDRWLIGYSGVTVGMCRERLLQDRLPNEAHDRPVHIVVTEKQVLHCSPEL
jgi:5-formyltetrahydrofolate cyclo-ligase